MLIKEYRIPLPLNLEEYRIAQLYMIQKKSREESEGEGSGVEFIENRPYTDGPNGSGQYTYKIYHIGRHLPSWFRSIAPKTALEVHEESWNAYPYTKTRFSVPFVEKFSLELETYFEPDGGTQENIFKLSVSDQRNRTVDMIDIVNDTLSGSDYKQEEDPNYYHSTKTQRGPLSKDWITNPPNGVIMCSYKLVKVDFRYWGLQSKVEHFIHDYGLRRVMLRAHRQAWAWQDEWEGLTMGDIRRLERETQLVLQRKLGRVQSPVTIELKDEGEEEEEEAVEAAPSSAAAAAPPPTKDGATFVLVKTNETALPHNSSLASVEGRSEYDVASGGGAPRHLEASGRARKTSGAAHPWSMKTSASAATLSNEQQECVSDNESMCSARYDWALSSIALPNDPDSDLEFFDAQEDMDDEESEEEEKVDDMQLLESPVQEYNINELESSVDFLFLVVHGGSPLNCTPDHAGRKFDFDTISQNMLSIAKLHYHSYASRIAFRMVLCPNMCASAVKLLCSLSPLPLSPQSCNDSLLPPRLKPSAAEEQGFEISSTLPLSLIPLLATDGQDYASVLREFSSIANSVYQEFIKSPEGAQFSGQVCLLADSMGSVLCYDTLLQAPAVPDTPSPISSSVAAVLSSSQTEKLLSKASKSHRRHKKRAMGDREKSLGSVSSSSISSLNSTHLDSLYPCAVVSEAEDLDGGGGKVGFDFPVSQVFAFGSPLGQVLASRQLRKGKNSVISQPICYKFFNIVYAVDPMGSRIEPLLDERFARVKPYVIPSYEQFPIGNNISTLLKHTVAENPYLFGNNQTTLLSPNTEGEKGLVNARSVSTEGLNSRLLDRLGSGPGIKPFSVWWTNDRIDYICECPRGLESEEHLPIPTLSNIVHSRYWEAKELASFVLRQIVQYDRIFESCNKIVPFVPQSQVTSWNKRSNARKIKHLNPCHRALDIACVESGHLPTLSARFRYGHLVSLKKELVELHLFVPASTSSSSSSSTSSPTSLSLSSRAEPQQQQQQQKKSKWNLLDVLTTDKDGRIRYTLLEDMHLSTGLYSFKFLVLGDHTTADCNVFVLPPDTEAVILSVDGALAANFPISAKDLCLLPGAVGVARCWQQLGYLIVYNTGRPFGQKEHIVSFLTRHNFPLGLVLCADTMLTDTSQKTLQLTRLKEEAKVVIHAAYGSPRHLAVYRDLGLQSDQIFIHVKKTKTVTGKKTYQPLVDAYASHLELLRTNPPRRAVSDVSAVLGHRCYFSLSNCLGYGGSLSMQHGRLLSSQRSNSSVQSTHNQTH